MLVSFLFCLISCPWGLPAFAICEKLPKRSASSVLFLVPKGRLAGDSADYLPEKLEVFYPKIQGPNFTLYLTHIPWECKLHQCKICWWPTYLGSILRHTMWFFGGGSCAGSGAGLQWSFWVLSAYYVILRFYEHLAPSPLPRSGTPSTKLGSKRPIQPGLQHFQEWGTHNFSEQPLPASNYWDYCY